MRRIYEAVPMVSTGTRVAARKAFDYEDLKLEPGQVFELRGRLNDQRLVDLAYLSVISDSVQVWECTCGRGPFATEEHLRAHQQRTHGGHHN